MSARAWRRMWPAALTCIALGTAAHAQFALRGNVVANGGTVSSSATQRAVGTIGQPAVGISAGATFIVHSGFWHVQSATLVAVDPTGPPDLPQRLEFRDPVPNPARGTVHLVVALPQAAHVDLAVFDVMGREVSQVAEGTMEPGVHTWRWAGDDKDGRTVRDGIYFARLVVDGRPFGQRRTVLIR